MSSDEANSCPNCRGSARIVARFRFIHPDAVPVAHDVSTPAASVRGTSQDSFQSVATILPWFPAPMDRPPAGYFHASTSLPGGRHAILVDPGAWTNVGGSDKARDLAKVAVVAGYKPRQQRMQGPLAIQGVGNGTQQCKWEASLPIACPVGDGQEAQAFNFETPLVEGTGSGLPLILGLRSMAEKQGVLEMGKGKERLSFPGPGGYKIEWSPGTIHLPLTPAPSGHLMMPCAEFDRVPSPTGGLETPVTTLHATGSTSQATSASSSSSSQRVVGLAPSTADHAISDGNRSAHDSHASRQ